MGVYYPYADWKQLEEDILNIFASAEKDELLVSGEKLLILAI